MWHLALTLLTATSDSLRIVVAPAETLRVTTTGEGPPVVLVPGVFGSAFAFRKLTARLTEAGLRSVVIEPLGFGGGSRPRQADYSLTAQADRIAAVLDSLVLGQVIVVGQSMSGSIALRIAYRRPDLVRAVVSLEGGPVEAISQTGLRSVTRHAGLIKLFGAGAARRKFRGALIRSSGDPSWVTDSVIDGYTVEPMRDLGGMMAIFSLMVATVESESLETRLGLITCPVRLLLGTAPHPEAIKAEEIDRLRRTIGNLTIDSIPGAGHHLSEERPDLVAQAILQVHAANLPAVVAAEDRSKP